jgi:hypothetical protein
MLTAETQRTLRFRREKRRRERAPIPLFSNSLFFSLRNLSVLCV